MKEMERERERERETKERKWYPTKKNLKASPNLLPAVEQHDVAMSLRTAFRAKQVKKTMSTGKQRLLRFFFSTFGKPAFIRGFQMHTHN